MHYIAHLNTGGCGKSKHYFLPSLLLLLNIFHYQPLIALLPPQYSDVMWMFIYSEPQQIMVNEIKLISFS